MTYAIDGDDLWPRTAEFRYRLYSARGDDLDVLAATPTPQGAGLALASIHDDLKEVGLSLSDLGKTGVLDVRPGEPTGEWIVLPFDRAPA